MSECGQAGIRSSRPTSNLQEGKVAENWVVHSDDRQSQLCCGRSLFLYVLYRTLLLQKCSLSSLKKKVCPFLVNLLDIVEKNTLKCKIF